MSAADAIDFEALFGASLQTKDGEKPTKDVLAGKKAVLVYFSAHWCPPCRGFTPVLAKTYSEYSEGDVEIVFVSSDQEESGFNSYFGEMPWVALPFKEKEKKNSLSTRFGVRGIPMLIVLKPDGSLATDGGRGAIQTSGDMKQALAAWGL